jgi:hypothetical protein
VTILKVGGEAECYNPISGQAFAFEATSGRYQSTASRYAMKVQQGVSEITLTLDANVTEMWMHAYIYQEGVAASDYIIFTTIAGTNAYKIALESDGRWSLYKWSSGAWGSALATSASPVIVNGAAAIDIHIKRNATGEFTVYKNGSSVVTFSGDTTGDAANFGLIHFIGLTSASNKMDLSQVVVTDTVDTRGWALCTLTPSGAGTTNAWGGAYTDIDDTTYDEADYLSTSAINNLATFAATDINAIYNSATVKGVAVAVRGGIDIASAVTALKAALHDSGADYVSSNLVGPTNDGVSHSGQNIWETDPATAAAWASVSAVNAVEIGVKSA